MDANPSNAGSIWSRPFKSYKNVIEDNTLDEKNALDSLYVNHAEVAWQERRRAWVGHKSQRSRRSKCIRKAGQDIPSWSAACKVMLSTSEPAKEPIPLAEVVDFLVDIWLEEGLYSI